jgi:two-component system NtrC family response regulator
MKILLADDEKTIAITLGDELEDAGHDVTVASDGETALQTGLQGRFDVLITDIRMPKVDGLELMKRIKEKHEDLDVVVMTAFGTIDTAIEAMKNGAFDFLQKPFNNEEVVLLMDRIQERRNLVEENRRLKGELEEKYQFENIIGKSDAMLEVFELIQSVAESDISVLIDGESGTGKEQVARAIHYNSPRRDRAMVPVSCSVFADSLIESELFGHEKGAFTDAKGQKIGRFEMAEGGTIFIDDIDDLSLQAQVKMLRVLQERQLERVGGTKTIDVDIRVIAATKVDLWEHVQAGNFREDLFYRLNVVTIKLPPLRERAGDIPLLAHHFMKKFGGEKEYEITPETLLAMEKYPWPGNVRELEHAIERAIVLTPKGGPLKTQHVLKPVSRSMMGDSDSAVVTLKEAVVAAEADHIRKALKITEGHKGSAAELLGISRKNLWEKMKDYEIQ